MGYRPTEPAISEIRFKRARLAPIEGNSRSSAQLHQLMTFLLDHLDVSSIASKLVTLLEPNRFDEAFDAEGNQH
jgi:hypothetical protein